MAYSKLPLTTQDHFIGYQSVNQAIDNNQALADLYDAKHSLGVGGGNPFGMPTRAVGRHDDILIARSVADFEVDTSIATPTLRALVNGPIFGGVVYQRVAAGRWRIFVATPQLVGAVALMKSTTSVDQKATCYLIYDPTRGPTISVSTWVQDAGSWTTDDLPFSLVVWTQQA